MAIDTINQIPIEDQIIFAFWAMEKKAQRILSTMIQPTPPVVIKVISPTGCTISKTLGNNHGDTSTFPPSVKRLTVFENWTGGILYCSGLDKPNNREVLKAGYSKILALLENIWETT